jgi:hypothetical protein
MTTPECPLYSILGLWCQADNRDRVLILHGYPPLVTEGDHDDAPDCLAARIYGSFREDNGHKARVHQRLGTRAYDPGCVKTHTEKKCGK